MTGWPPPSPGNLSSSQTPICGNVNSSVWIRTGGWRVGECPVWAIASLQALLPTVSEAPHHERSHVDMQVYP